MDDNSTLPSGVTIERVCGGYIKKEAYVTVSGEFSFQLGSHVNNPVVADASDMSSTTAVPNLPGLQNDQQSGFGPPTTPDNSALSDPAVGLAMCDLRAASPGMKSSSISLAGRHGLDNPDVGTLVLTRLEKVSGSSISATTYKAPKDARKAFEKAEKLLEKNKVDEAQADLQKAVQIYPQYAQAWFELGRVHERLNHPAEARQAFDRSIASDSKFVSPYIDMALLAGKDSKWQEVADITDRALALDPIDYPVGYYYNSIANFNLKHYDVAEKSALKAQRNDPQHHFATLHFLLAKILVSKNDLNGAAVELKNYLQFAPQAPDAPAAKLELARIEQQLAKSPVQAPAPAATQPAPQPQPH